MPSSGACGRDGNCVHARIGRAGHNPPSLALALPFAPIERAPATGACLEPFVFHIPIIRSALCLAACFYPELSVFHIPCICLALCFAACASPEPSVFHIYHADFLPSSAESAIIIRSDPCRSGGRRTIFTTAVIRSCHGRHTRVWHPPHDAKRAQIKTSFCNFLTAWPQATKQKPCCHSSNVS